MSDAREEIARLVYRYADGLDRGDFAGVGQLFAHARYGGAEGQPVQGAAAVEALLSRLVKRYDGIPRTQHVTTNLVIDLEAADSATAHSCFTVLQAMEGFPLQPIVAGRYQDRFERGPSGWRFRERVIFMDLVGDLGRHLSNDPQGEP